MIASASPNSSAIVRSSRLCPRNRGRHRATSTAAPKTIRRSTVPLGPRRSKSPFAIPAPLWTVTAAASTRNGAGTRRSPLAGGALAGVVRGDGDHAPAAAGGELHPPGTRGEDRVVPADARAVAGLEPRAALAHDDLATGHCLAGEDLHAQPLALRVAAVPARSEPLLMSHLRPPRPSSSPPDGGSAA